MSDEIDITSVMSEVYKILKPLEVGERNKVVRAVLTLFDDRTDTLSNVTEVANSSQIQHEGEISFSQKVRSWMQKNSLTADDLSSVFHFDADASSIIASEIPGKSGREQTISVYILTGIARFVVTGEASFDDELARSNCQSIGCFNKTNHTTYIKNKGNAISGSKTSGWILTIPGMKTGAELVKEIART